MASWNDFCNIPNQSAIPITTQPGDITKSPRVSGLDWIRKVDELFVNQQPSTFGLSFFGSNSYTVRNALGLKILDVTEVSSVRDRLCLAYLRPFELKLVDNNNEQCVRYIRSFTWSSCLDVSKYQIMQVIKNGKLIGTVEQEKTLLVPKFQLKNSAGEANLFIKGPKWRMSIGRDVHFNVFTCDGNQIGQITKLWRGVSEFNNVQFHLKFPIVFDVDLKVILLGACFLINCMFYEMPGNGSEDFGKKS